MSKVDEELTKDTIKQLRQLSWVSYVGETDREDSTHRLETHVSIVRMDTEVPTLENLGATVKGISTNGDNTARIYVTI